MIFAYYIYIDYNNSDFIGDSCWFCLILRQPLHYQPIIGLVTHVEVPTMYLDTACKNTETNIDGRYMNK